MRALLYEADQDGKKRIVDYGIRLDQLPHYRPVLNKVLDYALAQEDIARAGVVSQFLTSCDPQEKVEGRYFDITLSEAKFAHEALAKSRHSNEKRLAYTLKGRIDAEHAFMIGMHEHSEPTIAAVYKEVGFERVVVSSDASNYHHNAGQAAA